MICPTTETLERLALGFLEDEAPVRAHVKGCATCATRMKVLGGDHAALTAAAKDVRLPRIAEPRRNLWKPLSIAAGVLFAVMVGVILFSPGSTRTVADMKEALESADREMAGGAMKSKYSGSYAKPADPLSVYEPYAVPRVPPDSAVRLDPKVALSEARPAPKVVPPNSPAPPPPVSEPPPVAKPEPAKGEPPPGDRFAAHVLNPAILAAKESTSTFALDVDTASYTMVRRYLMEGQLPPPEAVRVEEFLNYFRYADPKPPKGAFQVILEAAPSPFDADRHLLRIAVQAKEITDAERKDVVLTFVIDVSGSMAQDNRLALVKRSLHELVNKLRATDKVGIVVYGSTGRKLLDPTAVRHRAQILGIIDELRTEGSTNLESGLTIGYDLAAQHYTDKAVHRVIVCTDGMANNGITDPETLLGQVAAKAKKGVWLSVLGFGMNNVHDALMEKLADKGNGNYAYIDEFKEAKKIFTEKLVGMMEVVAADAKVQVEFDPATVVEYRQIGYENRRLANEDFRNDKVDAGEVGANHHVTALYEVRLKAGGEGRLATVRLRYREPDTKEVVESQESLGRGQVLGGIKDATSSYRLAAAVAQFAEVLRGSKAIKLERVLEEASRASADLGRPEDAVEFVGLVKRAIELRK
ncbi:MAG TPA: von Willebrand factor type A domain-containing protein [Planctomycetota bacterium]|nr:von Willebrand factor type A domain-containing protein [Planctomycetota bacterium]